jgi:hypothetical protein
MLIDHLLRLVLLRLVLLRLVLLVLLLLLQLLLRLLIRQSKFISKLILACIVSVLHPMKQCLSLRLLARMNR